MAALFSEYILVTYLLTCHFFYYMHAIIIPILTFENIADSLLCSMESVIKPHCQLRELVFLGNSWLCNASILANHIVSTDPNSTILMQIGRYNCWCEYLYVFCIYTTHWKLGTRIVLCGLVQLSRYPYHKALLHKHRCCGNISKANPTNMVKYIMWIK